MIRPEDIDLAVLLEKWCGLGCAGTGPSGGVPEGLPARLSEWYLYARRWPRMGEGNRMLDAQRLATRTGIVKIAEDGTGDWEWGLDLGNGETVYEREYRTEWAQCPEPLPEFLTHFTLVNLIATSAVQGTCDEVPCTKAEEILAPLELVGFAGWQWPSPGQQTFAGDGILATTGPAAESYRPRRNKEGFARVHIAAVSRNRLAYLSEIGDVRWRGPLGAL